MERKRHGPTSPALVLVTCSCVDPLQVLARIAAEDDGTNSGYLFNPAVIETFPHTSLGTDRTSVKNQGSEILCTCQGRDLPGQHGSHARAPQHEDRWSQLPAHPADDSDSHALRTRTRFQVSAGPGLVLLGRSLAAVCHLSHAITGSQTDIFVHHELVEITDRENCVNSKLCKQEPVASHPPWLVSMHLHMYSSWFYVGSDLSLSLPAQIDRTERPCSALRP